MKWVWAAVKPKGFRVKPKLKLKKAWEVRPAEGSELDSGSVQVSRLDHSLGSGWGFRSDLSDSNPVSSSDLGSGPVLFLGMFLFMGRVLGFRL